MGTKTLNVVAVADAIFALFLPKKTEFESTWGKKFVPWMVIVSPTLPAYGETTLIVGTWAKLKNGVIDKNKAQKAINFRFVFI